MRKAILAVALSTLAFAAFAQHSKTEPSGGKTNTNKAKPKPQPKPTLDLRGIDTESLLKPIPPDEILFSDAERQDILGHPGWREASKSAAGASGIQEVIYYDRKRIERRPNRMIRAWLKTETVKAGESGFQFFLMELMEYDCSESRMRTVSSTKYDKHYQSIEDLGQSGWSLVIPDSVGERLYGILCKGLADNEQLDMETASEGFMKGRRAEKKGDLEDAQSWYESAIKYAPRSRKLIDAVLRVGGGVKRNPAPPN